MIVTVFSYLDLVAIYNYFYDPRDLWNKSVNKKRNGKDKKKKKCQSLLRHVGLSSPIKTHDGLWDMMGYVDFRRPTARPDTDSST